MKLRTIRGWYHLAKVLQWKCKEVNSMETATDNWYTAFLCVAGEEGVHWYRLPLDEPEWIDPKFAHQN